jgi:DNA-binding transcriptional LysR family regulator
LDDIALRLTANHFRLIVAIADEKSLVGAAKLLNMTQPAVTKSLQVAESQLEVQLFQRTTSGMVPTIYGEALIAQARIVLLQLRHAAQDISDLCDGNAGRVLVGTLSAPSAMLLPTAIVRLREKHPKLTVKVIEGTNEALVPALRHREIDMIVGRLPDDIDRSELTQEILFQDVLSVVAAPSNPLVGRKDLSLADLVDHNWVLPPDNTSLRRQIDRSFQRAGLIPPTAAIEVRSLQTMHSILLQGDYLSAWSWQVVWRYAAAEQLGVVPIRLSSMATAVGITRRLGMPPSPAASLLAESLRTVSREIELPPE